MKKNITLMAFVAAVYSVFGADPTILHEKPADKWNETDMSKRETNNFKIRNYSKEVAVASKIESNTICPISVSPADGDTVSSILDVVLTFDKPTYTGLFSYPTATLVRVENDSETKDSFKSTSVTSSEDHLKHVFTFNASKDSDNSEAIKKVGRYIFRVGSQAFFDDRWGFGNYNEELTLMSLK